MSKLKFTVEQRERFDDILLKIENELARSYAKHGPMPSGDFHKMMSIITEECGEIAQAILKYEDEFGSFDDIEKELIETATMCVKMLFTIKK